MNAIINLIGIVSFMWLIVQLLLVVMLDQTLMVDKNNRMASKQLIRSSMERFVDGRLQPLRGRTFVPNLGNDNTKDAARSDATVASNMKGLKDNGQEQPGQKMRDQSLLVVMNVKIQTPEGIAREIRWIQEDSSVVCKFYPTCHWEINMVLDSDDDAFREPFAKYIEQALSMSSFEGDVKIRTKVFTGNFNKFSFVQGYIDEMANYDLFLLKDSDIRINSFSWTTFIEKRANALISAPIIRSPAGCSSVRQNYRLYDACYYENSTSPIWASDLLKKITAVEVPSTEQYFALMDGKFASFYFNLALRPGLIQSVSDWSVNECWCAAAKAWDESRPGCYLVPIVAKHEDTRQVNTTNSLIKKGEEAWQKYHNDPVIGRWCWACYEWMKVIALKDLNAIERDCRLGLGLRATDSFNIQACATAAGKLKLAESSKSEGHEALKRIGDEIDKYNDIGLNKDSEINPSGDIKMLEKAKRKLEERLHGMGQKG